MSFEGGSMTLSGNRSGSLTDDIVEKRRLRRTITGIHNRCSQCAFRRTRCRTTGEFTERVSTALVRICHRVKLIVILNACYRSQLV